jgi:hypothetical protein
MTSIEEELATIKGNQKAHDERDVLRFESVHETLQVIQNNHLFHIEKDIATLKEDNAVQRVDLNGIKVDMVWVKWGVTSLIGGVGALFIALVIRGL